jgi:holo-[acyl-carrier protein] synthase
MIGLGIDFVDLEEFEGLSAPEIFRPDEVAYAEGKARPAQHLAARWAAKRAAIRALGGGDPGEIEVVRAGNGDVRLRLSGGAKRRADELGVQTCHLSLTHTGKSAAALVLFERKGP